MNSKIIKNIPNLLTMSRIISSVIGAIVFILGNVKLAIGLYIYGAISDYFDGLAARKLNAFSEFGRKLDALSDKIYAASLLIPSIVCGNLLMLIPAILELKISHINLKSQKLGFKTETQRIGKFKTALLFPTMITGLLATTFVEMYLLLLILLPISTVLQVNSITVYENLLNYNIKHSNINKQLIHEKSELEIKKADNITKEIININDNNIVKTRQLQSNCDSMNVIEELVFYVTTPYFKQDDIYKTYTRKKRRMKN